ncbi:hypothetical protein T11_6247 [Trichinella zimbabwensis]|uniref:Uncharacterized protein n=1 Tax=Trichinella zimbabwensis TaxID=268475 RepID=A0A0V1HKJ2_9BILA|nr:hypothetical protein T11_6247 [Trichinella zimbabwensis]
MSTSYISVPRPTSSNNRAGDSEEHNRHTENIRSAKETPSSISYAIRGTNDAHDVGTEQKKNTHANGVYHRLNRDKQVTNILTTQ